MPANVVDRPASSEYAPYYAGYVARVPEGDVLALLETQVNETLSFLRAHGEAWATTRFAPGKWSVKEVVGHLSDVERVLSYRALRIARGDRTPLPGFEQDDYVRAAHFDRRSLADLLEDFAAVRTATMRLFHSLEADAWMRSGIANNLAVSVRALAYIIAGHERHHVEILRTRYVPAGSARTADRASEG
jgi:DinB superfamily